MNIHSLLSFSLFLGLAFTLSACTVGVQSNLGGEISKEQVRHPQPDEKKNKLREAEKVRYTETLEQTETSASQGFIPMIVREDSKSVDDEDAKPDSEEDTSSVDHEAIKSVDLGDTKSLNQEKSLDQERNQSISNPDLITSFKPPSRSSVKRVGSSNPSPSSVAPPMPRFKLEKLGHSVVLLILREDALGSDLVPGTALRKRPVYRSIVVRKRIVYRRLAVALRKAGYLIAEEDPSLYAYFIVDRSSTNNKLTQFSPIVHVQVASCPPYVCIQLYDEQNKRLPSSMAKPVLRKLEKHF